MDVAGRGRAVPLVAVDWLNCDLPPYEDFGRPFGPTLLEKLLFDGFRDDADGAREDVEDVNEGFRLCIDFPAPTSDVPFTAGLALVVGAAMDLVPTSPALSANVFRFGSGSLYVPPSLCFRDVGGGIFEIILDRALFCDSEISARPIFGGEGIRLPGGLS